MPPPKGVESKNTKPRPRSIRASWRGCVLRVNVPPPEGAYTIEEENASQRRRLHSRGSKKSRFQEFSSSKGHRCHEVAQSRVREVRGCSQRLYAHLEVSRVESRVSSKYSCTHTHKSANSLEHAETTREALEAHKNTPKTFQKWI